jgi:ABC-type Fe3+/spermidine/putrescine transport system ATPase subunit
MTDMPTLLEARALVKRLGGRLVVDGVDLDCHAGQVLGLLGPNGAGKTTTLRMLYGFLSADGGAIRFEGADVSQDLDRFKRQLGVCTQDDTFDGDFTVRQNLEMAARYFRPRTTSYVAIVALVLSGCRAIGLLQLELEYLPLVLPIVFVSACAFAALGLCFTALVPTIDHMNLPIFLVVLPLGFVSATYFPLDHPVLAAISTANPLYHLAEALRGLLLGGGPGITSPALPASWP